MCTNCAQDSEPAFFSYVSQLRCEKTYFFEEALPDWKHKAMRVTFGGLQHLDGSTGRTAFEVRSWWEVLQDTVDDWIDEAEEIAVPDFKETVADYKAFQEKEIRKTDARDARNRRRKTMLDLERPDPEELKLRKADSGVVMDDMGSD